MNVLVIGLGSMGKRRIRLLRNHFPDIHVAGVDTQQARREDCRQTYAINVYPGLADAMRCEAPQCAFICTSPLSHSALITQCLEHDLHVFTELNLVDDGYERNLALARTKGRELFLSSTFLYRKEIRHILSQVHSYPGKLAYTYHVGQYLPDWHPWESYKDFFLGDKRTNGCREILAIEMPWIIRAFGRISGLQVVKSKVTALDVDYPDSFVIGLEHESGHIGSLVVDLVAREAVRSLNIMGESLFIRWAGKPDSLEEMDVPAKTWRQLALYQQVDKQQGYSANIVENAYLEELRCFFDALAGKAEAAYGFADDLYTLSVIERIEG